MKMNLFACFKESDEIFAISLLFQTSEDHLGTGNHFLWIDKIFIQDFGGPDNTRV